METVLLTGATGVLGRELRPRLRDHGYGVRAASRSLPTGGAVEWVELDLVDGQGIQNAVNSVDFAVHAASQFSRVKSWASASLLCDSSETAAADQNVRLG